MPTYITDRTEINFGFKYPHLNNSVLLELSNITKVDFGLVKNDFEKAKVIIGYVHALFKHDGDNKPSSYDPLTIIKEARQGKSFRCVEYSLLATALLWAHSLPARTVGLKTHDVETSDYGAGHVVIEFWNSELKKWIMCDVQKGIVPIYDNTPLSAYQLQEKISESRCVEYVPVANSRFSVGDAENYNTWIKPYLYFFDTPIEVKMLNKVSEQDRRNEKLAMLVPVNVKPPNIFQKSFLINAIYTHSAIDFYPKIM